MNGVSSTQLGRASVHIETYLDKLKAFVEKESFKGYDPYDALNSPMLKAISLNSKFIRLACIQFIKRNPVNLRPFLGIKKDYNPKGLGLFLWGYVKLYAAEKDQSYLEIIEHLITLLGRLRSQGYSGNCWGYNFDWQSRVVYVPKYTPSIVNSSFIGHALLDAYRVTGNEEALKMAVPIKDFILKDLQRKHEGETICFSYTPKNAAYVHNANLLGASLLVRLSQYSGHEEVKMLALSSLAYSMKYQRDDGSWTYAETESQQWIDSYHTGFNLQSIQYFLREDLGQEYSDQFQKGVAYYQSNLFLEDGTPKFYHNRTYPIDIHAPAQAIVFFSRMGTEYRDFTEKIATWMVDHMADRNGYFYYQIKKNYTNRIPYIRWGQAWAFHALTEYTLNILNEQPSKLAPF